MLCQNNTLYTVNAAKMCVCALFEIYHACLTLIIYILSLLPLLLNTKINDLPLFVSPIVLAGRS